MGGLCSCIDEGKRTNLTDDLIEIDPNHYQHCSAVLQVRLPSSESKQTLDPVSDYVSLVERRLGAFVFDEKDGLPGSLSHHEVLPNGCTYIGQKDSLGRRAGRGVFVWEDGAKYTGYWKDDQAHGRGRLIHADGDVYEGQWSHDKAHGHGTYTHFSGGSYCGDWQDDEQHGYGVEQWADGTVYKGSYRAGLKHGQGTFVWADHSAYIGEFVENRIEGKGVYEWNDGRRFEG